MYVTLCPFARFSIFRNLSPDLPRCYNAWIESFHTPPSLFLLSPNNDSDSGAYCRAKIQI